LVTQQFEQRTRELIDSLKAICASYGLGNDGNEFKIITQVFLYKFLNDKFAFEAKKINPKLASQDSWESAIAAMSPDDLEMLQMQMGPDTAKLKPEHFIAHLFGRQNAPEFAKFFDDTLRDIAISNNEIFAVKTDGGAKITLFDRVSDESEVVQVIFIPKKQGQEDSKTFIGALKWCKRNHIDPIDTTLDDSAVIGNPPRRIPSSWCTGYDTAKRVKV
jgi:type I restriction-modification system DNA methylase subunit